jgi:hypothetical protein
MTWQQMGVSQRQNHCGLLERKPSDDLCGAAYRGGQHFYSDDFAVVCISKHDFLAFQAS